MTWAVAQSRARLEAQVEVRVRLPPEPVQPPDEQQARRPERPARAAVWPAAVRPAAAVGPAAPRP